MSAHRDDVHDLAAVLRDLIFGTTAQVGQASAAACKILDQLEARGVIPPDNDKEHYLDDRGLCNCTDCEERLA